MDLRDKFARSAKHNDLAIPASIEKLAEYIGIPTAKYRHVIHWSIVVAKARYVYADAMLGARNEPRKYAE